MTTNKIPPQIKSLKNSFDNLGLRRLFQLDKVRDAIHKDVAPLKEDIEQLGGRIIKSVFTKIAKKQKRDLETKAPEMARKSIDKNPIGFLVFPNRYESLFEDKEYSSLILSAIDKLDPDVRCFTILNYFDQCEPFIHKDHMKKWKKIVHDSLHNEEIPLMGYIFHRKAISKYKADPEFNEINDLLSDIESLNRDQKSRITQDYFKYSGEGIVIKPASPS
jgi:hypothetical protein